MDDKEKIKVSLFLGEKNFVQKKGEATKTGYKRHYESDFFNALADRVDFKVHTLYPIKGRSYSVFRHLLNHFWHPIKYFGEFVNGSRIKHIMFAEEAFMLNFLPGKKTIVSCLDVIPIVFPNEVSGKFRMFLNQAYRGMKKAALILANSEYTKSDIVRHLNIDPDKIMVAYPPVNGIFRPGVHKKDDFYNRYGLKRDKRYLLIVGALDLPRKNIREAVKAFAKLVYAHNDLEFLLVGYTTLKGTTNDIETYAASLGVGDKVKIIKDVPDKDLVKFYNLAEVFVFPTLYEGFGLPPLEAMACGTPVVTSAVASVPEVCGEAAVYSNPRDADDIADKVDKLLRDKKLREEKIKAGLARAALYTWKNYADSTYKAYLKLAGGR